MKRLRLFGAIAALAMVCGSASAAFTINEVDSDTANTPSTDAFDFVELKGNPNEPGTGLVLVFFNGGTAGGNGVVYRVADLGSATADANGYLVVGTTNVTPTPQVIIPGNSVQNGEDAVALYQAAASSFPNGTTPQSTNLIDFVVYETGDDPAANWSGFGQPVTVYDEAAAAQSVPRTVSRIPDGTGGWTVGESSPMAANFQLPGMSFSTPTIANDLDFVRFNQTTAPQGTSMTLTLRNTGTAPLTVNSLQLAAGADPAFSTLVAPSVPVTLQGDDTTTIAIQFLDASPTTNKTYTSSVIYNTDNPTSPSGSVRVYAELARFTTAGTPGSVKINEISYDPDANDYNNNGISVSQDDEFMEFYNTTASPIVIEGWESKVFDRFKASQNSFVFPAGTTIPPNGFVTVFANGTQVGFAPGSTFSHNLSGRIYNPGSFANLNDGNTIIDAVAYSGAEDVPDADGYKNMGVVETGGSIGSRPDGSDNYRAFVDTDPDLAERPTPNASNGGVNSVRDWSLFE